MNNVCVTITTGRSGSTYLQNVFRRTYPEQQGILHESLHPGMAKTATHHRKFDGSSAADPDFQAHMQDFRELLVRGPVVDFGWVLGCLAPAVREVFGSRLRVLLLTAHPVSVAASFANRGHYSENRNPAWAISPHHENSVFQQYQERWADMTPFEKGLFRWLEITRFGIDFRQRFPDVPTIAVRSDEMFRRPDIVESIAGLIGFESRKIDYDVGKNESLDYHVERRPIGEEWRKFHDMPEVVDLADSLGFDTRPEFVEKLVRKYQVSGLIPRLRHRTGYWAMRERIGGLYRRVRPR